MIATWCQELLSNSDMLVVLLCGLCDHKLSMMVLSMLATNWKKNLVVVVDLPQSLLKKEIKLILMFRSLAKSYAGILTCAFMMIPWRLMWLTM